MGIPGDCSGLAYQETGGMGFLLKEQGLGLEEGLRDARGQRIYRRRERERVEADQ